MIQIEKLTIGGKTYLTTTHDTPLTLGCETDANGTPFRFCGGQLTILELRWQQVNI